MDIDLYLDPVSFDLPLRSRFVSGVALVLQRIRIRLQTFLGEVLFNRFEGLPFFDWWAVKPPPLSTIEARLVAELADVPEVIKVTAAEATFDVEAQEVKITGQILIRVDDETTAADLQMGIGNAMPVYVTFFRRGRIAPLQLPGV